MKTAGLIGGIGWPSTISYYRLLNRLIQQRLGDMHSAQTVIATLDFADVYANMVDGTPHIAARKMAAAALKLKSSNCDLVAILSNTGHFAATEVQESAGMPLIHIGVETAAFAREQLPNAQKIGLLATRFALSAPFFQKPFSNLDFEVLIPDLVHSKILDELIFGELTAGNASEASGRTISHLCGALAARGAQGIVLGCTELGEALQWIDSPVPVFESTEIHSRAIVREMLSD